MSINRQGSINPVYISTRYTLALACDGSLNEDTKGDIIIDFADVDILSLRQKPNT